MGESKEVGAISAVTDEKSLNKHLDQASVHLCIIVLEKHKLTLPDSMLSDADIPLLVLTNRRTTDKLTKLFQLGGCPRITIVARK